MVKVNPHTIEINNYSPVATPTVKGKNKKITLLNKLLTTNTPKASYEGVSSQNKAVSQEFAKPSRSSTTRQHCRLT